MTAQKMRYAHRRFLKSKGRAEMLQDLGVLRVLSSGRGHRPQHSGGGRGTGIQHSLAGLRTTSPKFSPRATVVPPGAILKPSDRRHPQLRLPPEWRLFVPGHPTTFRSGAWYFRQSERRRLSLQFPKPACHAQTPTRSLHQRTSESRVAAIPDAAILGQSGYRG